MTEQSAQRDELRTQWFSLRGLREPEPAAGFAAFRVAFGLLLAFSATRFIMRGWVDTVYLEPAFHFTWAGLDFVRPWPRPLMYAHVIGIAISALWLASGVKTRLAALMTFALFTWAELIEKAAYLNHYYLVSVLLLWLVILPVGDAPRFREVVTVKARSTTVPRFVYFALRAQIAAVYFYAGVAKLNSDWLLRGEPLRTWLQHHGSMRWLVDVGISAEVPALAMSWGGAAFDLTIWLFMLWPKTRGAAFVAAICFHTIVGILFPIGVFPVVMVLALTLFFNPAWPSRFMTRQGVAEARKPDVSQSTDVGVLTLAATAALLTLQLTLPARHYLYPGNVNWTEEGFRFGWRVMLLEKTGSVEYRVTSRRADRATVVYPRADLTELQHRMLAVNPDMIQDFAHELRLRYSRRWGVDDVEVRVDSFVSWNGRPSTRWIDPHVDLAAKHRGVGHRDWILPAP